MVTCSAAGEANNTEVLGLWWLLGQEISKSEQHAYCQMLKLKIDYVEVKLTTGF